MKDPWSIVLGAALALVGTVLVQSWIVPRTQRRIRQRERWEKDARELADLLAKTLPPRLFDLAVAMGVEARAWTALAGSTNRTVKDQLDKAAEAAHELKGQFDEQIDIMQVLVDRAQHVNRDAPGWEELRTHADIAWKAWTRLELTNMSDESRTDPDDVDYRVAELKTALVRLSEFVERLIEANSPPKRRPTRYRVWQRVVPAWQGVVRVWRRIFKKSVVSATEG